MTVKLLSLDAFGTALRIDKPFLQMKQALAVHGLNVPIEIVRTAFQKEMQFYRQNHLDGKDDFSLRDLRVRCAGVLFDALGELGYKADFPPGEKADLLISTVSFVSFEDVAPLVEACRERNIRIAMTSNWDCSLEDSLKQAGLGDVFETVIISACEGTAKPDPAIFETLSVKTQVGPSEILHIGDEIDLDFHGARHAGLQAAFLDRESKYFGEEEPVISSLEEAISLLE